MSDRLPGAITPRFHSDAALAFVHPVNLPRKHCSTGVFDVDSIVHIRVNARVTSTLEYKANATGVNCCSETLAYDLEKCESLRGATSP